MRKSVRARNVNINKRTAKTKRRKLNCCSTAIVCKYKRVHVIVIVRDKRNTGLLTIKTTLSRSRKTKSNRRKSFLGCTSQMCLKHECERTLYSKINKNEIEKDICNQMLNHQHVRKQFNHRQKKKKRNKYKRIKGRML